MDAMTCAATVERRSSAAGSSASKVAFMLFIAAPMPKFAARSLAKDMARSYESNESSLLREVTGESAAS